MAQLVIAAAAAYGGYAAGPALGLSALTGAQIGWSLGLYVGAQMTAKNSDQQVNNTQNVSPKVTGTEYGEPIPYLRGVNRTAGQLWWASLRRSIVTVSTVDNGGNGGKGGGSSTTTTTNTTYEVDLLFGLSINPMIGVSRVWINGELVYNIRSDAGVGTVVASNDTPPWARITSYSGDASQLPDPTYEAAVGAANAPAYRGRGSVFIEGLQLGPSGQLPSIMFEVVTDGSLESGIHTVFTGTSLDDQYIPDQDTSIAGYPLSNQIWVEHYLGAALAYTSVLNLSTGAIDASVVGTTFGYSAGVAPFPRGIDSSNNAYIQSASAASIYKVTPAGVVVGYITPAITCGGYGMVVDSDGNLWATDNFGGGAVYKLTNLDWSAHTCTQTTISGANFGRFCYNSNGISGRIYGVHGSGEFQYIDTVSLVVTEITSGAALSQVRGTWVGYDGNLYAQVGSTFRKYSQNGALLASLTNAGFSGSIWIYDHAGFVWLSGAANFYKVNASTMLLDSTIPNENYDSIVGEPISGVAAVFDQYLVTGQPWTRNGIYVGVTQAVTTPPTVSAVVSDLSLRAGLTAGQFDVTALASITKPVHSLAISQVAPMRPTIELLMSTHFFGATVSDKVHFNPRGSASALTIPYNDLAGKFDNDSFTEPFEQLIASDLEMPAQVTVTYPNISNDLQGDTQASDVRQSLVHTVSNVQIGLGLTPSEAKSIANVWLLDQLIAAVTSRISLLGSYTKLEPTDVITITDRLGNTYRFRIVKRTDSFPVIAFEVVADNATILDGEGITTTDYTPSTVVSAPAVTSSELLDIPILQEADNDAGFYIAAKGSLTTWPGCAFYRSPDNVNFTSKASVLEAATFGTCTTILGDWTDTRIFDEKNTVMVNVGDGTLSSSTRSVVLDNMAVNAMLIGSELIQFRTATIISAGIYVLSGLLRGCRGTEWAMTSHIAGERCVLLRTTGLRRVATQNNELGLPFYYKAVTLGQPLSGVTAEAFTNNGIGLKPVSPFDLRAARDGSNNIVFTWQRRTRMFVRVTGALGVSIPLGEEAEAYQLEIYNDSAYTTVVRTISGLFSPTATYSAADQTADGLTPGNTVYAKVYQLSAVVGRGYPLKQAA